MTTTYGQSNTLSKDIAALQDSFFLPEDAAWRIGAPTLEWQGEDSTSGAIIAV